MSVPPGGYYVNPPPPAKSNSGGCLKAAGLTCGVLFLLGLVGVFVLVRSVKNAVEHPAKGGLFATTMAIGKATADGVQIQHAVVEYHAQKHKYPQTLTALVSEGLIDGKKLHNDLDENASPGHVTWQYTRPAEDAPGETPILTVPYKMTVFGGQPPQRGSVIINLDGTTASSQQQPYGQPRYRSRYSTP